MRGPDRPVPRTPGPRKRSAVACQLCRQRKVRCNVFMSGPPCVNCSQDGLNCEVTSRRYHRPLTQANLTHASRSDPQENLVPRDQPFITRSDSVSAPGPSSVLWWPQTSPTNTENVHPIDKSLSTDNRRSTSALVSNASAPSQDAPSEITYGDNSAASSTAAVADKPIPNSSPYYFGEKHGIAFLLDVCKSNDGPTGSHFLVPKSVIDSQQPEDLAYLWAKGAFSMPTEEACEGLLQCYFRYVHPFLPVIDVSNFLSQYANGGPRRISSLLLWSMFSAASNFVDPAIMQIMGYSSRKEMKQSMYQRAKALYDCNYEDDKLLLIQSVILMSFWYSNTDDRTGSWHWIGVAIGLSQALGLNRNPDTTRTNWQISDAQRRLWRRIWWTCLLRDRWVSFIVGRPLRINLEDCYITMPSKEDVIAELGEIPAIERAKYSISDSFDLAECWVKLVKLSIALGKILKVNSNPNGVFPVSAEVELRDQELLSLLNSSSTKGSVKKRTEIVEFHRCQFQLHYEASIIVLYRPYLDGIVNSTLATERVLQSTAKQKVRDATASTHSLLDNIVATDMVPFLGPMTPTVLVPTMQIHLLGLRSPNSLTRQLALHKLDFCMAIMAELGSSYWSADLINKVFKDARDRLTRENDQMPSRSDSRHHPSMEDDMTTTASGDEPTSMDMHVPGILHSYDMIRDGACDNDPNRATYSDLDLNSLLSVEELNSFFSDIQQSGGV